jgi:hypothetical protein
LLVFINYINILLKNGEFEEAKLIAKYVLKICVKIGDNILTAGCDTLISLCKYFLLIIKFLIFKF